MNLDELRSSDAPLLSIAQGVEVLRTTEGKRPDPRSVHRACQSGQLPCIRIGRRTYLLRVPLLALLDGGRPPDEEEGRPDDGATFQKPAAGQDFDTSLS